MLQTILKLLLREDLLLRIHRRVLSEPGLQLELDGARWLASIGVRTVGADNMGWEVDDGTVDPDLGVTLPCHVLMLVDHGIHIIENMNLEQLGAEKVYESFLVCTPLKFVGATGSPVRPIAITGI